MIVTGWTFLLLPAVQAPFWGEGRLLFRVRAVVSACVSAVGGCRGLGALAGRTGRDSCCDVCHELCNSD
jgi:hypothetical protein